uniref:Solute carrier family 35 member B4 n=1 Tax=Ciona savignyi TaxID=51511 RepID=H2Z8F2_CIOSA
KWTVVAMATVIVGCCSNVVFLEYLIRASSSSGNMIVFFQFLFVFFEGLIFHNRFGKTERIIPLKKYVIMVMMHFTVSITNIMALDCDIPMPLHMIFKSGSLVANLLLGCIVMKRSYPVSKFVAVVFVSLGIFISTIATVIFSVFHPDADTSEERSIPTLLLGISLLTYALMIIKVSIWKAVLINPLPHSQHMIPLPFFIVIAPSIVSNIHVMNSSPITMGVPLLWIYLALNIVTQYICIRAIFYLTSVCTSLTVTLLITLRKFVSLLISVLYFGNRFTALHSVGGAFVLIGTLLYALPVRRQNLQKEKSS